MARLCHNCINFGAISKKEWYIFLSVALCIFLFVTVVYDVINYAITETTEYTTQPLSVAVLCLHILATYSSLLGLVYVTQKGIRGNLARYGIAAILANFLIYTARFTVDILYLHYRPEEYSKASAQTEVAEA